jgi:hypothetical protein
MGLKPLGYWFLFSGFTNQSTIARIYYIGGGKEGGRISQCGVFGGIEGGKVIGIEAVLSL